MAKKSLLVRHLDLRLAPPRGAPGRGIFCGEKTPAGEIVGNFAKPRLAALRGARLASAHAGWRHFPMLAEIIGVDLVAKMATPALFGRSGPNGQSGRRKFAHFWVAAAPAPSCAESQIDYPYK